MNSKTVTIPAISCGHCTSTIEMELTELAGVSSVAANKDSKEVVIEWGEPATWEVIESLLHEIEFPPAS